MLVNITQFMRPDGRQVPNSCEISDALELQYKAILANECKLTAEVLMTGHVSQAIEYEDGDFDIEICSNEPDAPKAALEKLIGRFKGDEFLSWLEAVQS